MLTKISFVYNDEGTLRSITLPIKEAKTTDSLLLREVTGLNPPQKNLFIVDHSRDGGSYQGSRTASRNVVFTIELNPNDAVGETVGGLRDVLYKVLMGSFITARSVSIVFEYEEAIPRTIEGYAETFEAAPFDENSIVQISFVCPDPYIKDRDWVTLEHPEGFLDLQLSGKKAYLGSAECGFIATVRVGYQTSRIALALDNRTIELNHDFLPDDVIEFNTILGARSITLTRAGETKSIVSKLNIRSEWLQLGPATNSVSVHGAVEGGAYGFITSFIYRANYWGA